VLLDQVYQGGKQPHIGAMPHLDLSDEEAVALVALLTRTADGDRYPLSPRIPEGHTREAPTRASPRGFTAGQGVCAVASNRSPKATGRSALAKVLGVAAR
jgi:hypothetical protein